MPLQTVQSIFAAQAVPTKTWSAHLKPGESLKRAQEFYQLNDMRRAIEFAE